MVIPFFSCSQVFAHRVAFICYTKIKYAKLKPIKSLLEQSNAAQSTKLPGCKSQKLDFGLINIRYLSLIATHLYASLNRTEQSGVN